jgi:CRP-like cAMP-binding protein
VVVRPWWTEPGIISVVIPLRSLPVTGPDTPFNPQAWACIECGVRKFALFGVLNEADLGQIHHHIADIRLEPGQTLYSANERGAAAYTVRAGVLRLERSSDRGERRIVRLAGRTTLVGMEAMLGQTYAADAVACTHVQACRLPRELIDELSVRQPELLRDLMKRWQTALDEADEWLTELNTGSARWRLLRLLLKLTEYSDLDGRMWLPSRQEMGSMLGMTVETASRGVAALRREGVVEMLDAHHARVDMPALGAALKAESEA